MEILQKSDQLIPSQENRSPLAQWIFLHLRRSVSISWEQVAIIGIAVTAFLSRLSGLGERVMSHDESLHVYYSWLLSTGKGFVHTPMMHGSLLFEGTALFNFLFGANDFTSRLFPAILGVLVVLVIPQLLRPWLGRIGALIAALLLLISPYMLFYSRYIRHDMLVIAWMLTGVFAIWGYLVKQQRRYLTLLSIALALMFSTMEITFIYLAIFASFLLTRMIWVHGLHWSKISHSREFDLLVVLTTLGAFFSSAIVLPVLNLIFTRITGAPYIDIAVLGDQGTAWTVGQTGIRLWLLLAIFGVASVFVGFRWGRTYWFKLAGLFLAINILSFTTFLTNLSGISSGFIGSLGYWLAQQVVARGGQPWYYFFIVFPIYEYLPLLGGIAAIGFFLKRRAQYEENSVLFVTFTAWWALGIFFALTLAGEKMPWLSTHIAVPFILLTAWWIGQLLTIDWLQTPLHPRRALWIKGFILGGVGVLVLLTIRTSYFVNYVNFDYSTEPIDYAHGAPGVKWVLADIQAIANHTGAGKNLRIAYDDEVSWPMTWYLKDYTNQVFYGGQPTRDALTAPVVLAGPKNWDKVELFLGSEYHRFEVIRLWWPIEDYKNLSSERIVNAIGNPEMRSAIWDILWQRDYRRYASLTGGAMDPPAAWPLAEKMRVYIRKDIALKMLGLSLGPNMLPDLPNEENIYKGIKREIQPIQLIQNGNLVAPRNVAIAKDGSIYVSDSGNGQIKRFSNIGELVTTWGIRTPEGKMPPPPGTLTEPWGIAVDGRGNVWVADTWNHRIQEFDPDGKFLLQMGSPGQAADGLDRLWGPRAVAVAEDGKVYVTDTGNKRIVVFSNQGTPLFTFGTEGDGKLDEPVGIAVGPEGMIFVADTWNSRVAIFSPDGTFQSSFPVQGWKGSSIENKPYLAVGKDNQVFLTDPEGFRVLVFTSTGDPLAVFGKYGTEENSLAMPNGIALDPDGSIWIADAGNNRIVRYPQLRP